jgi:hypothetical protein
LAKWTFYYGGHPVAINLNDGAKDGLADVISDMLSEGNTGWFTGGDPTGAPGMFQFYIAPGVPYLFVSDDAVLEIADPAPPAEVVFTLGGPNT